MEDQEYNSHLKFISMVFGFSIMFDFGSSSVLFLYNFFLALCNLWTDLSAESELSVQQIKPNPNGWGSSLTKSLYFVSEVHLEGLTFSAEEPFQLENFA